MADKVSHKIWSWSEKRRLAEISKCQILCHKCHLEKTVLEIHGHLPHKHGSKSMYKRGCRCNLCMEVPKKYNQERLEKRIQKIL